MLSDCMLVFLRNNDLEKARTILKKLSEEQSQVMGFARTEVLNKFCDKTIEAKDYVLLNECLKYVSEVGNTEVIKHVATHLNTVDEKTKLQEKLAGLLGSSLNDIDG